MSLCRRLCRLSDNLPTCKPLGTLGDFLRFPHSSHNGSHSFCEDVVESPMGRLWQAIISTLCAHSAHLPIVQVAILRTIAVNTTHMMLPEVARKTLQIVVKKCCAAE